MLTPLFSAAADRDQPDRTLHVVLSGDGSAYQEFRQGLESIPSDRYFILKFHYADDSHEALEPGDHDMVMAVGTKALRKTLDEHQVPVISTMVPSLSLQRLASEHEETPLTGIHIDQHPARQLKLIKEALPDTKRVGMITRSDESALRSSFDEHSEQTGVTIEHANANDRREVIQAVERLSRANQAILVTPSSSTRDPQHLRALLLRSFRSRIPVFAYSPGLVSAGSLMAIHSTPEMLGQEAMTLAQELADTDPGEWPSPRYPSHMEITINREVARSLGLRVPSSEELKERLESQERPEP